MFNLLLTITEKATEEVTEVVANNEEIIETISYWELIQDGGWYIMGPLFILLAFTIFLFVERYMAVNKALKDGSQFMEQIKTYLQNGNIEGAKALCVNTKTPIAAMLLKGISKIGKPLADISTSIENAGKLEIYKLEKNLSSLATIAGVAPMIGFLGTTIGMIVTFHTMSVNGVEIQNLSGGIMQAMVTTVGGLIVGILAYIAYNMLVAKVEKVIHNMEDTSINFLDLLQEPGK